MITLLLVTLLGVFKYIVLGFSIILYLQKHGYLDKKLSTPFSIVFSFLAGILLTSIILHAGLISNTLQFRYELIWVLALLSLINLIFFKRTELVAILKTTTPIGILIFADYIWQSIVLSFQPVMANDARGIWLLKAKAILQGAPSFFNYLQSTLYTYSHTDYPVTMPLLYADITKPLGTFWEPAVGILSITFFFMLIIGIYGAIRYYTRANELVALAITCVIFFTPEYLRQGWAGLSDVPLSLASFGVILALLLIKNRTEPKEYILPIMFAVLAATIKNEGQTFFLLTGVTVLIAYVTKFVKAKPLDGANFKKLILPILLVCITTTPIVVWKVVLRHYQITNDVIGAPNLHELATRIPILVNEISPRLFDAYRFGILFIPALILLLLPANKKETNLWSFIILGQAMVYVVIYLITPHDLVWHISTSFSRLLLHLLPSIYLLTLAHRSTKSIV